MRNKTSLTVFRITLFGMYGGLMFAAKLAMSFLPNIEPVSLMVMLAAVTFGWMGIFPVCVYTALEILVFGIGTWNVPYLYIWLILFVAARVLRGMTQPVGWALLSGVFGLLFGVLSLPSYWLMTGFAGGLAWVISGIPYDVAHCAGNFVIALVLFKPLRELLKKLYTKAA